MFTDNYSVVFERYSQRHYVKEFNKKYKSAWNITLESITAQLNRVDNLLKSERINAPIYISVDRQHMIVKLEFSVAGTNKSPKKSGNRVIAYVNHGDRSVRVLLVYCKDNVAGSNETQWWKSLVKDQFGEIMREF